MSPALNRCGAVLLLIIAITVEVTTLCEQKWDDIKAPHIISETYHIHLLKINTTDEYNYYMPNTKYQILLKADEDGVTFTRFYLTVENEDKMMPHGLLELYDEELSEFSQDCPDSVVQVSQVSKDDISTYWTSPEENSGCVIFRASVMESPSRWFMDGSLEQRYCQDPKAAIDDPGVVLSECCACNEAKYELAFEGLWSRYTHPKNFPTKPWSARFSDVIGASHTSEYRFWEYNGIASEGLRQVAENGTTRILESELKNQSINIRTIIKARGINFPNITSKTFAVFKVDQQHHLVSLVSMIDPSPDWYVGVSALELCLPNCTWAESRELNLYPIDAGTDAGLTYESDDVEMVPRDVIRQITTKWPADERSPFYDETAIDMNPMAKLYLKRHRVYEKECEKPVEVETEEEACQVSSWGPWTACSVTCGLGVRLRQRQYERPKSAEKHSCDTILTDRVACYPKNNFKCPPDDVDERRCALTPWTKWTTCRKSCGPENRMRSRMFRHKNRRKECRRQYPNVIVQQTLDCDNEPCEEQTSSEGWSTASFYEDTVSSESSEPSTWTEEETSGASTDSTASEAASTEDLVGAGTEAEVTERPTRRRKARRKKCPAKVYTEWSYWTPCSVTCGIGYVTRTRQRNPLYTGPLEEDRDCLSEITTCEAEVQSCKISKEMKKEICSQPEKRGQCPDDQDTNSLRYFYNKQEAKCVLFHYTGCNGNMNNFRTEQECLSTCEGIQDFINMKNYKVKLSSIVTYNMPVGNKQRAKCDDEKPPRKRKNRNKGDKRSGVQSSNVQKVDCRISPWSDWSPCYSCKSYRTMNREIVIMPRNGGKPCPTKLIRRQKCHNVLDNCESHDDEDSNERGYLETDIAERRDSVNCRVTPWGPWTNCSATCGESQRRRGRDIKVLPRGPRGKLCPPLAEIQDCQLPVC